MLYYIQKGERRSHGVETKIDKLEAGFCISWNYNISWIYSNKVAMSWESLIR